MLFTIRRLAAIPAALLYLLKPFRFLYRFYPRPIREFMTYWDAEMLRVYAVSLGKKAYMDQPCTLIDPDTYAPKAKTSPEWRLTPDAILSFYERGFAGPFTLCSPEEMARLREEVLSELARPSSVYGFHTGRDRHLDCPSVASLIHRPALTERLGQILGPDLLLWRSQVFLKPPGAAEVGWHQASTYLMEAVSRPALFPPDINRLFQLEAWVAFDDVDEENGCMRLIPGSHRRIRTMRLGKRKHAVTDARDPSSFVKKFSSSFGKGGVRLDHDYDDERNAVKMEMKAGQFMMFTEQVIHGSLPNRSDRRRFAMAFRVVPPDVRIYAGSSSHSVEYLNERYDLTNWGAVLVRGVDSAGVNRLKLLPAPQGHERH